MPSARKPQAAKRTRYRSADPDPGQAEFADVTDASLIRTYGTFAFVPVAGNWIYTLDNTKTATQALKQGQAVTDTLTVTSLDGTATQAILVTVTGANDAAVITGTATGTVTEDSVAQSTAGGTLKVTDVDTGEAVFQTPVPTSLAGSYGAFTFNATTGVWGYTLANAEASVQALATGEMVTDRLTVASLDDRPALDVYLDRFDAPAEVRNSLDAFIDFAVTRPLGIRRRDRMEIRYVGGADFEQRTIQCIAEVPAGGLAWTMSGDAESVLDATDDACTEAIEALGGADPLGLMVFDCIARRSVLTDEGDHAEVARMRVHAGDAPVAGFYTYGEIARTRGAGGFHNQTLVALALG
jgi:VCBS repeat-containing protein